LWHTIEEGWIFYRLEISTAQVAQRRDASAIGSNRKDLDISQIALGVSGFIPRSHAASKEEKSAIKPQLLYQRSSKSNSFY
jgi:hypothetical protein